MKTREIKVDGCINCPFCDMNDMSDGFTCRAIRMIDRNQDSYIKEDMNFRVIDPGWCPLKSGGIKINIK